MPFVDSLSSHNPNPDYIRKLLYLLDSTLEKGRVEAELEQETSRGISRDGSHVYFVQAGRNGPIKIGTTTDLKQRLKELQTGCPYTLRLLLAVPGDRKLETTIHNRLSSLAIRGEWFWPRQPVLKVISTLRGALDDQSSQQTTQD